MVLFQVLLCTGSGVYLSVGDSDSSHPHQIIGGFVTAILIATVGTGGTVKGTVSRKITGVKSGINR